MPTLKDPGIRQQYTQACSAIYPNFGNLSERAIRQAMVNAVNLALSASGVPQLGFHEDLSSTAYAEFDFQEWRITFGNALSGGPKTSQLFKSYVNTVYHESRHCEQWYRMAQGVARGNDHISNFDLFNRWKTQDRSAATIHQRMFIKMAVATQAVTNPDYAPVTKFEVQNWFRSVYGMSRTRRGQVLTHIQLRFNDYRSLPEEIDAWSMGDSAEHGVELDLENAGTVIRYPNVQDWKTLTGRKWHFRSGIVVSDGLRQVDAALLTYQNGRNPPNLAALKQAFQAWYDANPKERTKRNVPDAGDTVGCVEKLRQWLATH
jgi:hypothetical protein